MRLEKAAAALSYEYLKLDVLNLYGDMLQICTSNTGGFKYNTCWPLDP
jgi:hypothetical protein